MKCLVILYFKRLETNLPFAQLSTLPNGLKRLALIIVSMGMDVGSNPTYGDFFLLFCIVFFQLLSPSLALFLQIEWEEVRKDLGTSNSIHLWRLWQILRGTSGNCKAGDTKTKSNGPWNFNYFFNNWAPSCLNDLVSFENNQYNFWFKNILDIPRVRTMTYGKNSFRNAAAVLWNDLPDHSRAASSSFSYFRPLVMSCGRMQRSVAIP